MRDFSHHATHSDHHLSTGILSLRVDADEQGDLFRIAERQNPKRAFLFVSTILGRHIPVRPGAHRDALRSLAGRIMPHVGAGPVLVMSYAETAIGLGLGVFDGLCENLSRDAMAYMPTTRLWPEETDPWMMVHEEHSHAVDHLVFKPDFEFPFADSRLTLVLVDDETTTGKTFAGLADALRHAGVSPARVVLVTLTDWSDGGSVERVRSVLPGAEVSSVSLLRGAYSWTQQAGVTLPQLPDGREPCCAMWQPEADAPLTVPRLGINASVHQVEKQAWHEFIAGAMIPDMPADTRVLVIGTGEHVWHPFLAAEIIEKAGFETRFIATTRSPVARGPEIEHQITFADHYGLGLTMYLNNVDPEEWDEILLFTETGLDEIDPKLRQALGKGYVISADTVREMTGELV